MVASLGFAMLDFFISQYPPEKALHYLVLAIMLACLIFDILDEVIDILISTPMIHYKHEPGPMNMYPSLAVI